MSDLLHIPAIPGAPIACDMSAAPDTPAERLNEYGRLFEQALLRRERREDAVVFSFRAGTRAAVDDLARREAACCPFLDYLVESVGDEVVWTLTNPGTSAAEGILDAFYGLADADRENASLNPRRRADAQLRDREPARDR